jgi:hypothetical protein
MHDPTSGIGRCSHDTDMHDPTRHYRHMHQLKLSPHTSMEVEKGSECVRGGRLMPHVRIRSGMASRVRSARRPCRPVLSCRRRSLPRPFLPPKAEPPSSRGRFRPSDIRRAPSKTRPSMIKTTPGPPQVLSSSRVCLCVCVSVRACVRACVRAFARFLGWVFAW